MVLIAVLLVSVVAAALKKNPLCTPAVYRRTPSGIGSVSGRVTTRPARRTVEACGSESWVRSLGAAGPGPVPRRAVDGALRTLRRVRVVLARDLGLDPGPDLVALEQAILRQD